MITRNVGNHPYMGTDLPNVTLAGVIIESCDSCEEGGGVIIPGLSQLHRTLAHTIARSSRRLAPGEIRFLRKSLGWSGKDFARHIGADPATVSRWETGAQKMGGTSERLLRLAAIELDPVDEYPLPDEMNDDPGEWTLRRSPSGEWDLACA